MLLEHALAGRGPAFTVLQAVQEADDNARAQSSEHIKALQAQILKLQTGG